MRKVKKIFAAAIAAAITLTATGVAASADRTLTRNQATFRWSKGLAEMKNEKDFYRKASATLKIKCNVTGEQVFIETNNEIIGLHECVGIALENIYTSDSIFTSYCSGIIHSAGAEYSPVDWSVEKTVT